MAKGRLWQLQQEVRKFEVENGFAEQSATIKCLLLGEEVGELFKAIRLKSGVGVDVESTQRVVGEELADVFILLLALANRYELDLGDEMMMKLAANRNRTWK